MVDTVLDPSIADLLGAGYAALAQGRWAEGRGAFAAALQRGETPEALEGLGFAAYWQDDVPVVFASRERAYLLYRERGDQRAAARLACLIGDDHFTFRGEAAISNGWLQRAQRLLEGLEPGLEHGMLSGFQGFLALQTRHDVAEALDAASRTLQLARSLGSVDLEVGGLSIQGLALVYAGQVRAGMQVLDEATAAALSGEVHSPDMIMAACCFMIYACERVRDFERSAQWCEKAVEFCLRFNYRSILAFCRAHYAAVLLWNGDWAKAEVELLAANRELAATRLGLAYEGILRLAALRRLQGRPEDATRLLADIVGHPRVTLIRAQLAFDAHDLRSAHDLTERFLRQLPADNALERVDALELGLRLDCALGQLEQARSKLALLELAADATVTPALRGALAAGRGWLALAGDEPDAARRDFEDAVDLFERCGAPYEAALARSGLARALAARGRPEIAASEARQALETFQRLGAAPDATRVTALLAELGVAHLPAGPLPAGLTRREAEVLSMLARGLSNQGIADALFLSVRTVERHISSIYAKLELHGSTARAAAGAFAVRHHLAPVVAPRRST